MGCDGRYEATWEKFQLMVMTFTISTLVTIMITVSTLVTKIQTLKHSKCYFGHFIYFAYFGLGFRGIKVFFKSIARKHLWFYNEEVPCLVSGGPGALLI